MQSQQKNMIFHHKMYASFQVRTPYGTSPITAEHIGWEITSATFSRTNMKVRGRHWNTDSKHLLLYNGLEPHTETFIGRGGSEEIALVILPDFLDTILEEFGIQSRELIFDSVHFRQTPETRQVIETLFGYRDYSPSRFSCDSRLTELVDHILTQCPHTHSRFFSRLSHNGKYPDSILKTKKILYQNMDNPTLRLDDVAVMAGISKFQLIRNFKKRTGVTPYQYLLHQKMDDAHMRISRGEPIETVAELCGFNSYSSFLKAFRKHFGHAPTK